jgi:hypothetical protein
MQNYKKKNLIKKNITIQYTFKIVVRDFKIKVNNIPAPCLSITFIDYD